MPRSTWPLPWRFWTKVLYAFHISPMLGKFLILLLPWFNYPNRIWWRMQIVKLFLSSCYFLLLIFSSTFFVLKHLHIVHHSLYSSLINNPYYPPLFLISLVDKDDIKYRHHYRLHELGPMASSVPMEISFGQSIFYLVFQNCFPLQIAFQNSPWNTSSVPTIYFCSMKWRL